MTNATWAIKNLQRESNSGVVTTCYWEVSNETRTLKGSCTLAKTSVDNPNFVPYEDIDENIVLNWLFDLLGSEKEIIENQLSLEPAIPSGPSFEEGLPW